MFVLVLILTIIAFYFYATRNHNYWSKRNVKHQPPVPLFGNNYRVLTSKNSITQKSLELYNQYPNEKVVGYYRGTTPELMIKDPEIIRKILNVDFDHFHHRGLGLNPKKEILLRNLFHVDGDLWKLNRHRLTPTFTTSKLKNMFPLIVKCAEKMQSVAEGIAEADGTCDVRDLMARFATEFIGACGFGIEMDTINNEHSQFRKLGKLICTRTVLARVLFAITEVIPPLKEYIHVTDSRVENAIIDLVKNIRAQRNGKPIGRNDFIDLLLELETKKMVGESIEHFNPDGSPKTVEIEMDLEMMTAQVFIFFVAGFETSSSTTSMTLHQLAYHPDIQKLVQSQIDAVLTKYDNKLCYDAVAEMSLLDNAFRESMRIMPSVGVINRVCTKKYNISEVGITIDPGVKIMIPVQALQNDEKYFDNPTEFRPERFASEDAKERYKHIVMPFGEGPRSCIGGRLGLMQSLAGLAAFLHKFSVEPSPSTIRHPKVDPRLHIIQSIQGGLPLKLKLRKPKAA